MERSLLGFEMRLSARDRAANINMISTIDLHWRLNRGLIRVSENLRSYLDSQLRICGTARLYHESCEIVSWAIEKPFSRFCCGNPGCNLQGSKGQGSKVQESQFDTDFGHVHVSSQIFWGKKGN